MCKSLHLECAQKNGIHHTRTCLRSAMCLSSLLGGITLVSAFYMRSLMENASYQMLLSTYLTTYSTCSNKTTGESAITPPSHISPPCVFSSSSCILGSFISRWRLTWPDYKILCIGGNEWPILGFLLLAYKCIDLARACAYTVTLLLS